MDTTMTCAFKRGPAALIPEMVTRLTKKSLSRRWPGRERVVRRFVGFQCVPRDLPTLAHSHVHASAECAAIALPIAEVARNLALSQGNQTYDLVVPVWIFILDVLPSFRDLYLGTPFSIIKLVLSAHRYGMTLGIILDVVLI